MHRVEILKIYQLDDFLVAEKKVSSFLKQIHQEISQTDSSQKSVLSSLESSHIQESTLIGVFQRELNMWMRGCVIETIKSFGKHSTVLCYLVDTGETMRVSFCDCKLFDSKKLATVPYLGKRCKLFGIRPSSHDLRWSTNALSFFKSICDSDKATYHVLVHNQSQQVKGDKQEVELFLESEYLHIRNKQQKERLISINSLLVSEGFADQTCTLTSASSCKINSQSEDFFNVTILKAHLKTKCNDRTSSQLLDELFETTASDDINKRIVEDSKEIEKKVYTSDQRNILVEGVKVSPFRHIIDSPINDVVKSYLKFKCLKNLSILDWFSWPTIIRGRHCFIMPPANISAEEKTMSLVGPLMSALLDRQQCQPEIERQRAVESGYVKKSLLRAKNGPLLLIVCASCLNAQRIFEMIGNMIGLKIKNYQGRPLKPFLLQGGGSEEAYEVPLINGCDVLVAATPLVLLRMLGQGRTNLERLECLALDEAHLLLEKFPAQMRVLMSRYGDLLRVNENQSVAQLVLFSSLWSTRLKSFIGSYLLEPAYLLANKLEAAHFGSTEHSIFDCSASTSDRTSLKKLSKCLSTVNSFVTKNKNIIVFTNSSHNAVLVHEFLIKSQTAVADLIHEHTNGSNVREIERRWALETGSPLLLICEEGSSKFLDIDNAQCVINFDFPISKSSFANRMWFMRRNFTRQLRPEKNIKEEDEDTNSLCLNIHNEVHLSENDDERIFSIVLFTKEDHIYSDSFVSYLNRIGIDRSYLPSSLLKMARKVKIRDEIYKKSLAVCSYVKSFGKCFNEVPSSCPYRHGFYPDKDTLCMLDDKLHLPDEGYVKFKVCHVEDTNHVFINVLSHQDLRRQNSVEYDKFSKLDMDLQLFYSDVKNQREIKNNFDKNDMFVFKDITNNIFKRICVLDVCKRDSNIAWELLVHCIDYGMKLKISVFDLIRLPSKFKLLPPQAVEVYFCNIRPVDRDLNWSTFSKISIAERLAKSKEFVGKIQLAAGNTLWLHPVSSFKYLKELGLNIIDDCVRYHLVAHNFGVDNPSHIKELTINFTKSQLPIARQEDEQFVVEQESTALFSSLYENKTDILDSVSYAHLDKSCDKIKVFMSSCETLDKFWVQNETTYKQLSRLNLEIASFLEKIEKLKITDELSTDKEIEHFIQRNNKFQKNLKLKSVELLLEQGKCIFCLARQKSDNAYNRAKIISVSTEGFQVFFLDYGDIEWVISDNLLPLPSKFIKILPFQAIECGLSDVISTENTAPDEFWDLTHDKDNFFYTLFVNVVSQETDTKKYLIQIYKKNYPEPINIGYKLVALNFASLINSEKALAFEEKKKGVTNTRLHPLRALAKQLGSIFVNGSDPKNKLDFLSVLDSRSQVIKVIPVADVISSGIIQALSRSLEFCRNEIVLIALIKHIRKNVLIRKAPDYIVCFLQNKGLSNMLDILVEFNKNAVLTDFIFSVLTYLSDLPEFIQFIANKDSYSIAFWRSLYVFEDDLNAQVTILTILDQIIDSTYIKEVNISAELRNCVERSLNESECQQYEKSSELIRSVANKFLLLSSFRNSEKSSSSSESEDDEEKASMRRVMNYLAAQPVQNDSIDLPVATSLRQLTIGKIELQTGRYEKPLQKEAINCIQEPDRTPPNSSDEEVQEMFEQDLAKMFAAMTGWQKSTNVQPTTSAEDAFKNKPYIYPSIVWDQSRSKVVLKIMLKNVKEMNLNYGVNSISFRTYMNNVEYGFDFDLFGKIIAENCRAITKEDKVIVIIEKKDRIEWSRLLSSLVKLRFIKSDYNNLDTSSCSSKSDTDLDESVDLKKKRKKRKLKLNEFLDKQDRPRKHLGLIDMDSDSSQKTSDSSSNFEDEVTNDCGNDKDIYWD